MEGGQRGFAGGVDAEVCGWEVGEDRADGDDRAACGGVEEPGEEGLEGVVVGEEVGG